MEAPARLTIFTDADRAAAVEMAKIAESAERYHEMAYYMRLVAEHHGNLTVEERNLLSVAYKNLIGNVRASWRIVSSIEQRQQADPLQAYRIERYRAKIEGELRAICNDIIPLLDRMLAQRPPAEAQVFYYKMKGDYYRYLAEFSGGEERRTASQLSLDAYAESGNVACTDLPATNPIRLGLALSFATFTYEILNDPERACALAKRAFDDALAELDQLDEDNYKDSTLIMQLMRDGLTLWTSDIPQEQAEKIP